MIASWMAGNSQRTLVLSPSMKPRHLPKSNTSITWYTIEHWEYLISGGGSV